MLTNNQKMSSINLSTKLSLLGASILVALVLMSISPSPVFAAQESSFADSSISGGMLQTALKDANAFFDESIEALPALIEKEKARLEKEAEEARIAEEERKAAEAEAERQKLEEISEKLPYSGLEEEYIDKTWLGEHYDMTEYPAEGRNPATTVYTWASLNGKNDIIFYAYCKEGVVSHVKHGLSARNYWPIINGMPDRYASGDLNPKISDNPDPDPFDFDSPGEYADNAEGWFANHGYEDPWNAAYDYWCDVY